MSKLLSVLIAAAFATVSVGSFAASAGGAAKDDKKMNAGISYSHGANTHVLEQAIRMGFKKPGLRRLSELLQ